MILGRQHAGATPPLFSRFRDKAPRDTALLVRRVQLQDEAGGRFLLAIIGLVFRTRRTMARLNAPQRPRDSEPIARAQRVDV
jgi:hypothetical protein